MSASLMLATAASLAVAGPRAEYEIRLVPDLSLTATMLGAALMLEPIKGTFAGNLSCPKSDPVRAETCDRSQVNELDRWVIGRTVDGASGISDKLLIVMLAAPFVVSGVDASLRDASTSEGERLGVDSIVILQTLAASYFTTNLLKVVVQRLRPFNYDGRFTEERLNGDSRVSFPSGHASMSFAGAALVASLLDQRYPGEAWAVATAAAGFGVAGTIALLRVLANRHFPTDVLVGAAIGTTIGLLVPRAHEGRGSESSGDRGAVPLLAWGTRF